MHAIGIPGKFLRSVFRSTLLAGVLAVASLSQAFAAAIIIDNFSGTQQAGPRVFTSSQGTGAGTPPTLTELNGGGALRMQPQNSIINATITYTPSSTLDLTGGGTNNQFLVEFISVLADNNNPLQGLANLTITVNTTSGARQKAGLGIGHNQGNMAFPFIDFTGSGNFSQVTSIVLSFFSQTNVSSGWGTITLDRIWASPPAGAVPSPPSAGFTAVTTTPTANTTLNYALSFNNDQGPATVTGLANTDITISGTAGATTRVVTGSGSTYNVAVSGMTTDGTVILTLGANTVTDLFQQTNPAGATSSTINYVRPPVFTNGPPPATATVGTAYSFNYTTSGLGPITYALNSGSLPTGLTLSSAGAITGTPTIAGTFNGVTRATNVASTNQSFSIVVTCPTLTVNPVTLPNGLVNTAYSAQTLTTSGASGVFTYALTAGALPAGMTLSSAGVLSGTPTATGNFNFTVFSTGPNSATCTGSRPYTLSVAANPPLVTEVVSRKTHGAATHELKITTGVAVTGNVTVEPREIKAGHLIVFKFNQALTASGSVAAFNQAGTPIGVASVTRSGSEARVTLTGIPDNQRVRVVLTGAGTTNGTLTTEASMAFMVGDVSGSHTVNAADISAVKARASASVTAANFVYDLTQDGAISTADVTAVKARSGLSH